MTKKTMYSLIIAGLILIITGLIVQIIVNRQYYKKQLEEKDRVIQLQGNELGKLKTENEALWDNYYMNVSEYDGEYYE